MTLPTPAKLGLTSPRAAQDIEELSLDDAALLWTLAGAGDPDLALNTAHRFAGALPSEWDEVRSALAADPEFCTRFFALLGGSTALSDHLVANPHLWRELAAPLPSEEEMREAMLRAVEAEHIDEATYRAGARFSDKHAAKDALRETYRTLMMRIAAADLAGTFTPLKGHGGTTPVGYQRTTALLTALADAALTAALAVAIRQVYGDDNPDTALAVVAMGKCGARELNYISDVDVIFVAEEATAKATHTASEFMQLGTACFFEVDANLRPEGKAGALVRTLDSHVTYYKRWAETWEFQALLKARPTGAVSLGKRYVEKLAPLVWEASQRESFVEDVQAMRRRVLANVPESLRQRELKLGEGGLRDVEFAVQLLQLVHGRIDESLREPNTVEALNSLMVGGYVGREDTDKLIRAYEFLRLLEHRLQLQRFKRTHQLPAADDEKRLRWLARTAGFQATARHTAVEEMQRALTQLRGVVANLHERLFYRPLLEAVVDLSIGEATFSADAVKAQLAALGYRHPARAYDHLNALVKGTSRKAKLQAILLPTLMHWLAGTADPGAGLLNYRKLSDAALDRSWFLRMLRDEGVGGMRLMHILSLIHI